MNKPIIVGQILTNIKKLEAQVLKRVTKNTLSFDHYKQCLFNNEIVKCIQYRIKSTPYSVDTVQINKIALKYSDNKRLKSFNDITTFPYGTSAFRVCAEELRGKITAN